nr:YciK family oxidoreductase [Alteromonas flava]
MNSQIFEREIAIANNYSATPNELDGKVILITGAGDGIGKALATTYSALGATCILLGKTVSKLEAVYDEIVASGGPEPAIVPLDLKGATPQHYTQMGSTIIDQFGHLDGVVLNASILGALCPFSEISAEEYNDVMQVNVNSSFALMQGVLPALKLSDLGASVIFTTSSVGRKGRKFWGTYSISKFATEGMMEVLANEYSPSRIRFNCVNPGGTRTAMRAKAFPAEDPSQLKTPDDIMPTYCYLMSSKSAQVSGLVFDCQPK